MTMTWEEKYAAIKAMSPSATIEMRVPGNWYVLASMEHKFNSYCLVAHYGNGVGPASAVKAHWQLYADGRPFKCNGNWYRWNGYMWANSESPFPDSDYNRKQETLAKG